MSNSSDKVPTKRIIDPIEAQINQLESYTKSLPLLTNKETVLPPRELQMIALRSSYIGNRFDNSGEISFDSCSTIPNLVEETLKANPEVDLLTLGEHSLYYHPHLAEAIRFGQDKEGAVHVISGQHEVQTAIDKLQRLAEKYKANICIGTVCERENVSRIEGEEPLSIFHNTAIVINSEGKIVQLRRKTTGSESAKETVDKDSPIYGQAQDSALQTIAPVELVNKNGDKFTTLVCVCAERSDVEFYRRASSIDADVLVLVVDEGDDHYTERSRSRYENGYGSNIDVSRKWQGDIFMEIAKKLRVVTPDAIVLAADSAEGGQAGVFKLGRQDTFEEVNFNEGYVKAKCSV